MGRRRRVLGAGLAFALLGCGFGRAWAQGLPPLPKVSLSNAVVIGAAVAEASRRSGVPADWIRAVMRAESFGDPHAVSRKGAIGLMQIMPATYAVLRLQLNLGADPFDIHDNVVAGAAYMRLMFDPYGAMGMVGAYNAGPARWEAYIAGARLLPAETVGYVARLAGALRYAASAPQPHTSSLTPSSPLQAPMFVPLAGRSDPVSGSVERLRVLDAIAANPTALRRSDGLFGEAVRPSDQPPSNTSAARPEAAGKLRSGGHSAARPAESGLFAADDRRTRLP